MKKSQWTTWAKEIWQVLKALKILAVGVWRLLMLLVAVIRALGRLILRIRAAGSRSDPTAITATAVDDAEADLDGDASRDPLEILDGITGWDRQDARALCRLLNAYDRIVRSGADVPALDLRHVRGEDPGALFPIGPPVHFVALDRQGMCVIRSGLVRTRTYSVAAASQVGIDPGAG
ncbi:MAG: hypothetical protein HQL82_15865 [Magnetococcales bacterium]|nr:hypothetical protein [Magnetococcales bacterium]